MRRTLTALMMVLGTVATAGAAAPPAAGRPGIDVIGLTGDQRLVGFAIRSPGRTRDLGRIRGLDGDTRLVGIDYRVQNGRLYGVGDRGGVYTLSGPAKAVKVSQLTVALRGYHFGVDFSPAANRLRVISDTGQNLRHNLDDPTGGPAAGQTVADRTLTLPPVPPAVVGTVATGVSGAGYTNNDLSPDTATTLFGVNTATGQVSLQSPAGAGTLVQTGSLRVAASGAAGFDVYSSLREGVTVSNSAFAALKVAGRYGFYGINLLTGAVNYNYGAFPASRQVLDIAIRLDRG
ncbi:DUF4394 domain-containing protein [Streptosporangium sp. CA-115845]|uniref:DUF4394 domain-containing protein n=1 Tax=Streptosporangium sp. CA-115845 TaxID=3240071 RepID=UPI003D8D4F2C